MVDYINLPPIKFCADLFPAQRCPSVKKKIFKYCLNSKKKRLECARMNRSNLWISKAYFSAIKMDCIKKVKENLEKNPNF